MRLPVALLLCVLLRVDSSSFYSTFLQAVSVYNGELWSDAISLFHSARDQYLDWKQSFLACKQSCGDAAFPADRDWTLGPLTDLMKKSTCSPVCCAGLANPRKASVSFVTRYLYHYLQYAYFKEGRLEDAVAAAHTFLEANPEDAVMLRNMAFYRTQPGYSANSLVSREPDDWLSRFLRATDLYESALYRDAKEEFEEALKGYYNAVDFCLLLCGSSVNMTGLKGGDMSTVLVEVYKNVLNCRVSCPVDMSYVTQYAGKEGYEAQHYHYLQFCYYQLDQLKEAVAATMSFLELKPDDSVMKQNLEYYQAQPSLGRSDFTPRPEIEYHRALKAEKELLRVGGVTVSTGVEGPLRTGSLDALELSSVPKQQQELGRFKRRTSTPAFREDSYHASLNNWTVDYDSASPGKKLVKGSVDVLLPPAGQEAKERVVAEHLASDEECQILMSLAKTGATPGDGYGKNPNPHTKHELFEGLHILEAAQLARDGKVDAQGSHLYYDLTEKSRLFIESYFHLNSTLYFSYTHLVCRTSLPNEGREVNELSHPVHSDNCLIQGNGSICHKVPPAYTTRDYSGVLYLNDDFEGGDFFWAHRNLTIDTTVRPSCGRLVAFSAGDYHGVTGINSGTRCAVALWFTLTPQDDEPARKVAHSILTEVPKTKVSTHSEL